MYGNNGISILSIIEIWKLKKFTVQRGLIPEPQVKYDCILLTEYIIVDDSTDR